VPRVNQGRPPQNSPASGVNTPKRENWGKHLPAPFIKKEGFQKKRGVKDAPD